MTATCGDWRCTDCCASNFAKPFANIHARTARRGPARVEAVREALTESL
jgi:hypothetical protein